MKEQIRPRLRERKGFLITGNHGIGKSALLEWASDYAPGKVAFVSSTWTVKEILKGICKDWELKVINDDGELMSQSKWQVGWMEQAVYTCDAATNWLMIDDIHTATPAVLRRIKVLRERCLIVGAGVPPFRREELRRIMWGLPMIDVKPLNKADMMRLGIAAAPLIGTRTPVVEAVHAARGIPGQLFHALRGEVTVDNTKTQGEEIDISPVLLLVLVGVMMTRYLAVGMESTSLYVLGGIGMGLGLVFRFFLFKGMGK
ncbi:MAG: hypothetical protein HQK65_12175 [Desulfamplus sp.]|nr:hypothetical protein [Desulfamplus sp.]